MKIPNFDEWAESILKYGPTNGELALHLNNAFNLGVDYSHTIWWKEFDEVQPEEGKDIRNKFDEIFGVEGNKKIAEEWYPYEPARDYPYLSADKVIPWKEENDQEEI